MSREWRPVVGYEGIYSVSNLGEVRRDKSEHGATKGRILKGFEKTGKYLYVGLYKHKKVKNKSIHRLVAGAFIGECPEGYQVNHKNGNKADNSFKNLEYVTPSENQLHAFATGISNGLSVSGEKHGGSKLKNKEVIRIRELYKMGGFSHKRLAKEFNVSQRSIFGIIKRITWKHI